MKPYKENVSCILNICIIIMKHTNSKYLNLVIGAAFVQIKFFSNERANIKKHKINFEKIKIVILKEPKTILQKQRYFPNKPIKIFCILLKIR